MLLELGGFLAGIKAGMMLSGLVKKRLQGNHQAQRATSTPQFKAELHIWIPYFQKNDSGVSKCMEVLLPILGRKHPIALNGFSLEPMELQRLGAKSEYILDLLHQTGIAETSSPS